MFKLLFQSNLSSPMSPSSNNLLLSPVTRHAHTCMTSVSQVSNKGENAQVWVSEPLNLALLTSQEIVL